MSKCIIRSTCKCGAEFDATGNPLEIGCRFREWLEAHKPCLNREE